MVSKKQEKKEKTNFSKLSADEDIPTQTNQPTRLLWITAVFFGRY